MALFKKDDVSIYHPHIPRTGGRFVKELFLSNGFSTFHTGFEHKVRGIEVPHLHYPLYNFLEDVPDAKKIAVVRNPYDRFISALKLNYLIASYPESFFDMVADKNWLFSFLDYQREVDSYISNWFRPQHEFLEDNTSIYKFENGLNENFAAWIESTFNIKFNYSVIDYPKLDIELDAKNLKVFIDPAVKQYIQEYYHEDYSKLNYEEEQS